MVRRTTLADLYPLLLENGTASTVRLIIASECSLEPIGKTQGPLVAAASPQRVNVLS